MSYCKQCGKPIDSYDEGAHRKLLERDAEEYLCRDCIAAFFGWPRSELDALIYRFRQQGCVLFEPLDEEESSGTEQPQK